MLQLQYMFVFKIAQEHELVTKPPPTVFPVLDSDSALRMAKMKKPTASRIPKRSPIQVLTGPDVA